MRLHVVLIEPQFPGNLGFVARSMMNRGGLQKGRFITHGGAASAPNPAGR